MGLSEKKLGMWRKRIEASRAAMRRQGVLSWDGREPEGTRICRELVEMYRGNPDTHFGTQDWCDEDDQVIANKVFQAANQLEAELSAQRPDVQLLPRGGVNAERAIERAGRAARAVQPLVSWDMEELDMEAQHNDCLLDALFYPVAWMRQGFTPEEEHSFVDHRKSVGQERLLSPIRMERPDRPWLRRWAPWDVFPDPDATRFTPDGGMKWVAFRSVLHVDSIRRNPAMAKSFTGKELQELAGGVLHPNRPFQAAGRRDHTDPSPDQEDLVEVFTVYDATDRTWFQMSMMGPEKPLRDQDEWPIPWEWLPVTALVLNHQRDSPWGIPALSAAAPVQRELNHVRTMMSWLVRTIRRMVAVDQNKLSADEESKLETAALTEILRVNGEVQAAIAVIQSGGFPQELIQYEALLEEDLRESLGTSRLGRGQRINVESASEANFVQGGQDVHMGRMGTKYERFWRDNLRLHMQGRRATFDPSAVEVVPLLGITDAADATQWARVGVEEIHADLDFAIVPGSTRRRDRLREEERAMAALLVAQQNPSIFNVAYYARRLALIQGVNPEEAFTLFANTASNLQAVREVADTANAVEGPRDTGSGAQALQLAMAGVGGQAQ